MKSEIFQCDWVQTMNARWIHGFEKHKTKTKTTQKANTERFLYIYVVWTREDKPKSDDKNENKNTKFLLIFPLLLLLLLLLFFLLLLLEFFPGLWFCIMRIEPNIFQLVSYFSRLSDKGIKSELSLGSYSELSLTDPKWDPLSAGDGGGAQYYCQRCPRCDCLPKHN